MRHSLPDRRIEEASSRSIPNRYLQGYKALAARTCDRTALDEPDLLRNRLPAKAAMCRGQLIGTVARLKAGFAIRQWPVGG